MEKLKIINTDNIGYALSSSIGKTVTLIKVTKQGKYLVKDSNTKEYSVYKKNIAPLVKLNEIPYDLDDLLDSNGEIQLNCSPSFEFAMMFYGYLEYGYSRRSARIITSKAKKAGVDRVVEKLVKKSTQEIQKEKDDDLRIREIAELHRLASKYNYKIEDPNAWMDD